MQKMLTTDTGDIDFPTPAMIKAGARTLSEQLPEQVAVDYDKVAFEVFAAMQRSAGMRVQRHLIFDLGMSEGDDTDFYLRKGFRVVGVEADPTIFRKLLVRFEDQIKSGQLVVINRAAANTSAGNLRFFVNHDVQGHSQIVQDEAALKGKRGEFVDVETTNWDALVKAFGVPYYCKIDIENSEHLFLSSIVGHSPLPRFISAEAHSLRPVRLLYEIGYRKFRLINQTMLSSFPIPDPPREGARVVPTKWGHSSGLFAEELPGEAWLDFDQIQELFGLIHRLRGQKTLLHGWYDCHAYMPETDG